MNQVSLTLYKVQDILENVSPASSILSVASQFVKSWASTSLSIDSRLDTHILTHIEHFLCCTNQLLYSTLVTIAFPIEDPKFNPLPILTTLLHKVYRVTCTNRFSSIKFKHLALLLTRLTLRFAALNQASAHKAYMSAPVKVGGHFFAIEYSETSRCNLNFRVRALRTLERNAKKKIHHFGDMCISDKELITKLWNVNGEKTNRSL